MLMAVIMRVMSRSGARNLFLGALGLCLTVGYANEIVDGVELAAEGVILEVRESSIPGAGLGVFVAEESVVIEKDTLLTYYGMGQTLEADTKGSMGEKYNLAVPGKTGWVRFAKPWALPLPSKVEDGVLGDKVGHLINDAAMVPNSGLGLKRMYLAVMDYLKESGEGMNVVMGDDWGLRATKAIEPGQELFTSYGGPYWLHDIARHTADPLVRLQAFVLISQLMPSHFSQGALVFADKGKTRGFVRSTTNEAPDEEYSRWLVRDYLGAKNKKVLVELGLDSATNTGYPMVLMHLLDAVIAFDPEKDALPDLHAQDEQAAEVEPAVEEEQAVVLEEKDETLTAEA